MNKSNNFDLNIIWKNSAQKYKLKKKDYMLWCQSNDLIFSIFSNFSVKDEEYYLNVACQFKPMWADEIFWKITDSKSLFNYSKEPLSFRVIGSNVAPMKTIYINQIKLSSINLEETQIKFDNEIEKILEIIKSVNEEDYITDNEVSVINIIKAINNKDYKNARKILKKISNPFKLITGELKETADINTWTFKIKAKKYLRFKR